MTRDMTMDQPPEREESARTRPADTPSTVSPVAAGTAPVYDIRGLEVTLGGQPVLGPLDLQVARGSFAGHPRPERLGQDHPAPRAHGGRTSFGR